jgi:S1-C subfamily serine protease
MILKKSISYSIICLSIIYGKEYSEKKLYNHYRPIVGWVESSTGSGSGFLMNKDGLFVTAKHVVDILDTRIYIGGKEQEIEGIYWVSDPELDLIFFK